MSSEPHATRHAYGIHTYEAHVGPFVWGKNNVGQKNFS